MSFDRLASGFKVDLPRLMIAAPHGKSGKTTACIGICAALTRRNLKVQSFKKGPDFIDPSWLKEATGRDCHNLDSHLMTDDVIKTSIAEHCQGADIAVIEAAMGLFDGSDWEGKDSSSNLARLLGTPIVLVINATRMTRSVAALLNGYRDFEPDARISGVILNNVSNKRHQETLCKAIEQYCGIPVVGVIYQNHKIEITQRHLGLIPTNEHEQSKRRIQAIADIIEDSVDFDKILEIASQANPIYSEIKGNVSQKRNGLCIGVFYDRAFNFYYPENLSALENAGATLIKIDSIQDGDLPEVDALYIGGGFPELFLKEIEV